MVDIRIQARRTDWESFKQSLEEKINLMVPLRNEEQLEK
jgi:hypothetical protein